MAGGKPDYKKAYETILNEFLWLPEFISRATRNIIMNLQLQYPDGLDEIILEIKSCSSFMFEVYERNKTGNPNHKLQLFHYLKAKSMREGHIVYICKDDARILEVGVLNPSPVEYVYRQDIESLTKYIQAKQQPPLEKPIVFDSDFKKFSANWKVGYSNYLTMLYELPDQKSFDDKYKPMAERWNRVLGRLEEGKDMTENNLEAVKEIESWGFDFEAVKQSLEKKGAADESELR